MIRSDECPRNKKLFEAEIAPREVFVENGKFGFGRLVVLERPIF